LLRNLFAPYIKEKGIRDVCEIKKIRTITSSETKGEEAGDDLRLAFELGKCRRIFDEYKAHDLTISYTFSDTVLAEL